MRSLRGEEPAPQERDRDPGGGSNGGCSSDNSSCSFPPSLSSSSSSSPTSGSPRRRHCSALERLDTKLHLLRQEMVSVGRQRWEWGPESKGGDRRWGGGAARGAGRAGGCARGSCGVAKRAGAGVRRLGRPLRGLFTPDFARSRSAATAEPALLCVLSDSADSVPRTLIASLPIRSLPDSSRLSICGYWTHLGPASAPFTL